MSLSARRRERKARQVARLLVALDDSKRLWHHQVPRRSLRASLGGAR